jgi:RNA polymerase sigma-70 factor, ECF subfamily
MQGGTDDSGADGVLARQVAAGDRSVEGELCRRLLPRIRAYGLRHLRDGAAASDLAQQVLVSVLEALRAGRVEDPERLAAFVMGVCRNTLSDARRMELRRGALLEQFGPMFATTVEADAGVLDRDQLATCMQQLPLRARTIVILTYYAECDVDDIARELAMSAGTVRVARHRALKQLHECLGGGLS